MTVKRELSRAAVKAGDRKSIVKSCTGDHTEPLDLTKLAEALKKALR